MNNRGISLMECLIAIVILGIMVQAMLGLFNAHFMMLRKSS